MGGVAIREAPRGNKLIPGVISHATNIVEHPELVAQRIVRLAKLVGRENVMGGTDCGFAQSPFAQRYTPPSCGASSGRSPRARASQRRNCGAAARPPDRPFDRARSHSFPSPAGSSPELQGGGPLPAWRSQLIRQPRAHEKLPSTLEPPFDSAGTHPASSARINASLAAAGTR